MQGICLFMQLFGMHLCVYSIFLKAGSLYKFAIALAVASIWFTVLAAAPLRRLEHKVKSRYKIPFVKYPVADLFLLFTNNMGDFDSPISGTHQSRYDDTDGCGRASSETV